MAILGHLAVIGAIAFASQWLPVFSLAVIGSAASYLTFVSAGRLSRLHRLMTTRFSNPPTGCRLSTLRSQSSEPQLDDNWLRASCFIRRHIWQTPRSVQNLNQKRKRKRVVIWQGDHDARNNYDFTLCATFWVVYDPAVSVLWSIV